MEQHYGKEHPGVAKTLANLGSAHGSLGDYRQKKDLLERALRIMEQHYGKDHPEVAKTLTNLGSAHGYLGDHRQKRDLLERALRIEEQHYGKEHPEVAVTLTNLGNAHGDLGNHSQKKDLLERALRIKEQHYGKDHPDVAKTLTNLGIGAWKLRRLQAGEGPARACPENQGAALRERSSRCSQDFDKFRHCAWRPGRPQAEEDLLERALRINEQHYGKEHPEVAITVFNLGRAHDDLGDLRRAKELVERAFKIWVEHGHPYAEQAQRRLQRWRRRWCPQWGPHWGPQCWGASWKPSEDPPRSHNRGNCNWAESWRQGRSQTGLPRQPWSVNKLKGYNTLMFFCWILQILSLSLLVLTWILFA